MRISVCMATYNGSKYLLKQVESIFNQLSIEDELIILDDCSTDETWLLLKNFNDKRIKLHRNEKNLGHVQSFAKVLNLANNNVIVMADQDDIWIDDRLRILRETFYNNPNLFLISSNSIYINECDNEIQFSSNKVSSRDSKKNFMNICRIYLDGGAYVGCTMAYRSELNKIILPIPEYVESHDLWIALAGNIMKSNLHIDDITLKRRIHSSNASIVDRNLIKKLWSRVIFSISIVHIYLRILKLKLKVK